MICCDRCEEWFHGDCVGITEARGRLMERNGEDYICPNCTAKKNQVVRPAMSILSTSVETAKPRADAASQAAAVPAAAASSAERVPASGAGLHPSAVQPVAPPPPSTASGLEEKLEDQGIKGRIEKATNPSGKKKIKIFQPVGDWKHMYRFPFHIHSQNSSPRCTYLFTVCTQLSLVYACAF